MNRRKYLANLGVLTGSSYVIYNTTNNAALATNIKLPSSISVPEDITEKENPHLQLDFNKFEIKEQNYFGAEPKYTIKARTIYDNSASEFKTLIKEEKLINNSFEDIINKTYFVPLVLPDNIEDSTLITLQFKFNTNKDNIGPFKYTTDIILTISDIEKLLVEKWENSNFNYYNTQGTEWTSFDGSFSNDSIVGDNSLQLGNGSYVSTLPGDGAPIYPNPKDTEKFVVWMKPGDSNARAGFRFFIQNYIRSSGTNGYLLQIRRRDDEIRFSFAETVNVSTSNQWYKCIIEIKNNYMIATIEESDGTHVATLESSERRDETEEGSGFGFGQNSNSGTNYARFDSLYTWSK